MKKLASELRNIKVSHIRETLFKERGKKMAFNTIIYETKNGIGYITINRPKALNALSEEALTELSEALDMAAKDDDAKVVIITGAGGRAFVAGADISAMQHMTAVEAYDYARLRHCGNRWLCTGRRM